MEKYNFLQDVNSKYFGGSKVGQYTFLFVLNELRFAQY